MATRLDVKKVVENFNALKNEDSKKSFVAGLVYRHYVPFGEKYMVLKGMLDKSTYENDNGIKYVNAVVFKIDYMLALVSMYTSIDLLKDNDGKLRAFDSYDLLISSSLLPYIIGEIGDMEITEIDDINKALIDTFENENNNVANYVMTQLNNMTKIISESLNGGFSDIVKIANDKDKISMIKDYIKEIKNAK